MPLNTPQAKPVMFETLAWATELRSVGFSEEQATVQTKLFKAFIDDHIATQGDVHDVRLEIEKLRHETQREIKKTRAEAKESANQLKLEIEKVRAEIKDKEHHLRAEIKSSMRQTILTLGTLTPILITVFRFVHV